MKTINVNYDIFDKVTIIRVKTPRKSVTYPAVEADKESDFDFRDELKQLDEDIKFVSGE